MSIPKQPRQLMINIMYIVLTAMLALNVSGDVLKAFKILDLNIINSSSLLSDSNQDIPAQIAKYAKKDIRQYQKYVDRSEKVIPTSNEITTAIDDLITTLIDQSGNNNGEVDDGDYILKFDEDGNEINRKLKGQKNKDITSRILVGSSPVANDGEGAALEELITTYRQKYLNFIDAEDAEAYESNIVLRVDEAWQHSDKSNWSHFNFYQMPLGAVLPMLSKIKYDVKNSERAVLEYLMGKVGASEAPVFGGFKIVSSPAKNYIINNEKFETEISLGAVNKVVNGVKVKIDGVNIPVVNGIAKYSAKASGPGTKKYNVETTIFNPVTNTSDVIRETFEYEVGERFSNVTATKMNVIYIGVENPITVAAGGIPSQSLKVNGNGITLRKVSTFEYIATATQVNENASISVSGDGLAKTDYKFRVKKIPDPIAIVGRGPNKKGGGMKSAEFRAQLGLATELERFDWDARCEIQGYELTRQPKMDDVRSVINGRGKFKDEAKRLVQQAKPGDVFYFDKIKAKCPGDKVGRKLPSIIFKIR